MENKNFCYSARQSAVEFPVIIASPDEPEQDCQDFSANTVISPCSICGCTQINVVEMPDRCHFGAIRCNQCDHFVKWQSKPENLDVQKRRQTTIAALLKSPKLSQWEREFLQGLKAKKLSPKQQEILNRIKNEVGGQD